MTTSTRAGVVAAVLVMWCMVMSFCIAYIAAPAPSYRITITCNVPCTVTTGTTTTVVR